MKPIEMVAHLNVRLLHRGNRKLVLTDAGRSYLASCPDILEEIEEVDRAARANIESGESPRVVAAGFRIGRTTLWRALKTNL